MLRVVNLNSSMNSLKVETNYVQEELGFKTVNRDFKIYSVS